MRDRVIRYLCLTLLVMLSGTAIISGGIMLFTFFSSMYSQDSVISGLSWATLSLISSVVAWLIFELARAFFGDEFPGGSEQFSESYLRQLRGAKWLRANTWQIGLVLVAVLFIAGLGWSFIR